MEKEQYMKMTQKELSDLLNELEVGCYVPDLCEILNEREDIEKGTSRIMSEYKVNGRWYDFYGGEFAG
jgi:hypothetical protein